MIKWYKRILSHFFPQHIESIESSKNDYLDLYLIKNRLQLSTHDAIYSFDDLYYNFNYLFKTIKIPPSGAKVLILGMGLGSIPYMLEKNFRKNYEYTGVDNDETVLYLFSKYQQKRLQSYIQLYEADAYNFINLDEERYDMICIDLFVGEIIPEQFFSIRFITDVKSSLNHNGIVLWNMLYSDRKSQKETDYYYHNTFQQVFPNAQKKEILGNMMLIGQKKGN
ncbi:spermidine synthase [Membranihabitans maritimus]|uniref:spermidine synthase n=1 Tax=Membranihabitans maritimus TaxID=2904244 RepID=UPI001F2324B1|nr:hypothetical protein [Membranihabitans maritimus]